MARLARLGGLILAELLAHPGAFGLQHAATQVADDALERFAHAVRFAAVPEGEFDRLAARAVEDDGVNVIAQFLPRRFQIEAIGAREAGEDLHVIGRGRVGLGPGDDGALL